MSRTVWWSDAALAEFRRAITYIANHDPATARAVRDAIDEAATRLSSLPTGRPGRVTGTYEKIVARYPYILAYAIGPVAGGEAIVILHVIHTARDWPEHGWPAE